MKIEVKLGQGKVAVGVQIFNENHFKVGISFRQLKTQKKIGGENITQSDILKNMPIVIISVDNLESMLVLEKAIKIAKEALLERAN
ncbi:hypothetical protein K8R66_02880 [bacterium]|nr:hypothetical protein [bacterium]